ncbi:MAG: bifunctional (p)ppGpp synthetase/guanosine-3',5'-bis(diphosphate) 3'-pyrophosphohydrolase [Clostridia bacterium]|nr:bifunctional (p)ppGpp synthetase/guanosine-3',5'-bis(diphosphate) 3'-pyrophosphohydrolase [Clostridia bacterium]
MRSWEEKLNSDSKEKKLERKSDFEDKSDSHGDGFEEFFEKIKPIYGENELKDIRRAYDIAKQSHKNQLRRSGEPYIIHPIAVARILSELGMDSQSIIAALLHDTVEDTEITNEDIVKAFGEEIAQLVDGVTKLAKVPTETKEEAQAENIRKMLLAMSNDIRVIIIKLADRLHNMRTINFVREEKRRDTARETLEIYAPIAHRLGIRALKEELEDLAIICLDQVAYKEIENSLTTQGGSRMEFLEGIINKIRDRISPMVSGSKVEGRIKSVHGIYRKMYIQGKNFDEIYDIYAVRIIVESVIDCYNCLGVIHDMFRPLPNRFKDYISTPKPNMYQSLHTTVIDKEGIPFEVQIRTWEMHHTAEYGIAAHWKYKLGGGAAGGKFEERLTWIRQLLESQNDSEDVEDIVRTIKSDLVPEEVFVFTPKGDVISLPVGSTVIDFAYAIHSAIGNKMVGAKVDGRIVSLDYQVKTGEIVDVLTSSQAGKGPSRDWLKIVKTSEARSKIRNWFKKERREENIAEGRAEVEREFRRNYIRLPDDEMKQFLQRMAERQHLDTIEDFYAAIGYGGVSLTRMMPHIKDEYSKIVKASAPPEVVLTQPKKRVKSSEGVIVEGIDNCLIKFSRCCNPLPGDEIIGFITRGHGVSIHTRDCSNVPQDIENCADKDRWIKTYWDNTVKEDFRATLMISCLNRVGMLADISVQLANMHVMINDINTRNFKDGRTTVAMTITVSGIEHLKSVSAKLERIDGVLSVERAAT